MVDKGDLAEGIDARIAELAGRQHGVVAARQLVALGISRSAISKWAGRGKLHRLHQGVYAVGHEAIGDEGRWMAAVLACGPGAALSHLSAAALWELLKPREGPVDISLASQSGRRSRRGICIHRCASLGGKAHLSTERGEMRLAPLVTVRWGIPVTSVARTVGDLRRGAYPEWLVRKAIRQAEFMKFRVGVRTDRSRSDLERDFLRFCRRHGLPEPEVNVKVGKWTVDFLWRSARLAVETDFFDYHRGSVAFEDDHDRDFGLRRMGLTVHRYTGDQLRAYPAEIAAELGERL